MKIYWDAFKEPTGKWYIHTHRPVHRILVLYIRAVGTLTSRCIATMAVKLKHVLTDV